MILIELDNVTFAYNSKDRNSGFLLENINLQIKRGEFISILGPNGCGKSTMLKLIARLLLPISGNLYLENVNYNQIPIKQFTKRLAYVPQITYSIYPFSVFEIVMMGRTPYLNLLGFENKKDVELVNESLDKVGIFHLRNKSINEISGGEAQRAFIARALVQNPDIILLDESNSHLDIEQQVEIFNLLNFLNKHEELTIVAVSHDLSLVGNYSNRAILMKKGEILLDNNKRTVLTEENIKKIFKVDSIVRYDNDRDAILINIVPERK